MLAVKLVAIRSFRKLNLFAPVSGILCRIEISDAGSLVNEEVRGALSDSLAKMLGDSEEIQCHSIPRDREEKLFILASYFGRMVVAAQNKAGSGVSYASINKHEGSRSWDIFVECEFDRLGRQAAGLMLKYINQIISQTLQGEDFDLEQLNFRKDLAYLTRIYEGLSPSPAIQAFTEIANSRNIPWRRIADGLQYVQFGYGKYQKIFQRSITAEEPHTAALLSNNKEMTSRMLSHAGIPVASQMLVSSEEAALAAATKMGYPVVLKPVSGMQGYGITPNIQSPKDMKRAFVRAQRYHHQFLVENHIDGDDHRLLVIDGKYVGCVRRSISVVTGDGKSTIDELVVELNKAPWRHQFEGKSKYQVEKIPVITEYLKDQGYDWNSIPAVGAEVKLHIVPNLSQGGTSTELRDEVHPANAKLAERAASALGLKVAGIDYLTTDVSVPYWESGGGICEVNVSPGVDVMFPTAPDELRGVFTKAFELSFAPNEPAELPVVVVLDDKEGLALKVLNFLTDQKLKVGYCSAQGASLDGAPLILEEGDFAAVDAVLWNGVADAVVVDESLMNIRRYGLGYAQASIVVVTEMPTINENPAPDVLDLFLKMKLSSILINMNDLELSKWAGQRQEPEIVKVVPGEGQAIADAMMTAIVVEIGY